MVKMVKHNPILPRLDLTSILLIGGVGWLFLSDQGKAIRRAIAGDGSSDEPTGTGPSDPTRSPTPISLPPTAFRISSASYPFLIRRGSPIQVSCQVDHLGKAGQYVVGVGFAAASPGCWLGFHPNDAWFTATTDLDVDDDSGWRTYSAMIGLTLPTGGWGLGSAQLRFFVRDWGSRTYAEHWKCEQTVIV